MTFTCTSQCMEVVTLLYYTHYFDSAQPSLYFLDRSHKQHVDDGIGESVYTSKLKPAVSVHLLKAQHRSQARDPLVETQNHQIQKLVALSFSSPFHPARQPAKHLSIYIPTYFPTYLPFYLSIREKRERREGGKRGGREGRGKRGREEHVMIVWHDMICMD